MREVATSRKAQKEVFVARGKVKAGQRVCKDLVLNVIRRESFPDWDDLLLGVQMRSADASLVAL
jgi:hypothetical protein